LCKSNAPNDHKPSLGAGLSELASRSAKWDGKRFVVRADEKLMAFPELEAAIPRAIATTIE